MSVINCKNCSRLLQFHGIQTSSYLWIGDVKGSISRPVCKGCFNSTSTKLRWIETGVELA